jgi:phosphatidylserine decarboxylase
MSRRILMPAALCVLVFLSRPIAAQDVAVAPPIQALRSLYDNHPAFRANVDRAFANMKDPAPNTRELWPSPTAVNPWRGKQFEDLVRFMDDWYHLLPEPGGALDEFNFIEKFAWFYYRNEFGQQVVGTQPGLGWSREFVAARGKFLDARESTASIPKWIADPSIQIGQYIVPPEGYKSFNAFFVRDLKPGTRPIASPADDAVLVAPTDCVLTMINPLTPELALPTKLNQRLNVKALLNGSEYAKHFETGSAISCILLPATYHHYHAVVSGKVVESREDVAGSYWGIKDFGAFFNAGNLGYGESYSVFEHFRRGYVVIETPEYGYVAMIPVGLDTIGSVVLEDKFKQVTPEHPVSVSKGEKLGRFAYGGSLVITLIEQGISGITIPQGQQIGVFKQKKAPPADPGSAPARPGQ